jgi:hypothetical protein
MALESIPYDKLEKIHYAQLKIIKLREQAGDTAGVKLKVSNPMEAREKLTKLLKGLFAKSKTPPQGEDMLGLHFYVDTLKALPLDHVRKLEQETAREIKRRKEIARQRIDAGKIDRMVMKK